MATVIKANNISKQYRLGQIGTGTISHDLNRWWYKMRGREDPYLKIGEENDRSTKGQTEYAWALKDIDFEIAQGDVVGIIGRNGAGKSTLLKILSRTTAPTTGEIRIKGRVASLLEVGTGFHPDLTGTENIYLNGAILGMGKQEIKRKFDDIVNFAGVQRYIDTPVKRYSSGMYVRLAFAVAAHLESEILIVDEVLAVGDLEFQKKCLGKMKDVSVNEGRTVLFVSHQVGIIAQLCNKAILLNKGSVVYDGATMNVIEKYLSIGKTAQGNQYVADEGKKNQLYYFAQISTVNANDVVTDQFAFNESIHLKITVIAKQRDANIKIGINLQNSFGAYVATSIETLDYLNDESECRFRVSLPASVIAPNGYSFRFSIFSDNGKAYDVLESECQIKINDTGTKLSMYEGIDLGSVILDYRWDRL